MQRLFTIMPFGVRNASIEHFAPTIDFNEVYSDIIRVAAANAEWLATRIDEVLASGNIADQYLQELASADAVIADISIPNGNVYYELGIRQAVSAGPTILIAYEGTRLPFDLASQRVHFYSLSPSGKAEAIDKLTEILRFSELRDANPVQLFLGRAGAITSPQLDPAAFERELQSRIDRAQNPAQVLAIWNWIKHQSPLPPFTLLRLARRHADFDDWSTAVQILEVAISHRPNDFELYRELGWHLSKLDGGETRGLAMLAKALELNRDDPETLGMVGGIYKRLGDFANASTYYSLGAKLAPNNIYMRVNEAALAVLSNPAAPEGGAVLYGKLIDHFSSDDVDTLSEWNAVVLGEAHFALGNDAIALRFYEQAKYNAKSSRSIRSAADQLHAFYEVGFRPNAAAQFETFLRADPVELARSSSVLAPHQVIETIDPRTLPVLIHISDIHFGSRANADGSAKDMHRFYDGDYSERLSRNLIDEFTGKRAAFHFDPERLHLVVSGDLTYSGKRSEFDLVRSCLNEICQALGISKDRVIIAPGNHDVNWAESRLDRSRRFDDYLSFLDAFYGEQLFRSKYPGIAWDFKITSARPQATDIVSIYDSPHFGMTIACLNSCVYEDEQQHYGFIGKRQLQSVKEALEDRPSPRALRVAVLHHHLLPFPEYGISADRRSVDHDASTLRDAGIVEQQLERLGFDLVLHGHKHKPQIRETSIRYSGRGDDSEHALIVTGAGSVAVDKSELQHNIPNQYQVIEILGRPRQPGANFIRLQSRTLDVAPEAEWATSGTWTIPG